MRIVGWDARYAADFDRLNRWWLERWFTLEPLDEAYLQDPQGKVIAQGGEIFFALDGAHARPVGCCAAVPHGPGVVELAKLGVEESAHGRGVGRALCATVIDFARTRGAARVMLVSNSRLAPAIRLYESLGFMHAPFPFARPYVDADVYMELSVRQHGEEQTHRIVGWDPRYAGDVARLSREWIERDFTSKPEDEAYYADPAGKVIARGGEILLALLGDQVVGTCAAVPCPDGTIELSKLAVTERAKGRGIGRALCEQVIAFASARGARRVWLLTNASLAPALSLYASLGFVRRDMPFAPPHVDANVYMERDLRAR
jgi:putative acetyltransferase